MPRVKKLTRHLRNIARGLKPLTHTHSQESQDEHIDYILPREGYEILGSSCDREEWDAVLAEPDSDGPVEDETEDEDWEEARRTFEYNEDSSDIFSRMKLAAAALKSIKPRDGTTRQNLHHRKMVLRKAAVGTLPLSSFGFTVAAPKRERVIQPSGKVTE